MTARILVVDDVPANRRLLQARLAAEYYEVMTAGSGEEALALCASRPVDVVLLDVMMPGVDGFEVCRRLKRDPATADIPVIMVTVLDAVEDRIRGLEAGADEFLTKPANDLQLVTRVKSLVRLKMLSDELRLRAGTTQIVGSGQVRDPQLFDDRPGGRILLVDEATGSATSLIGMIDNTFEVQADRDPQSALFRAAEEAFDCVVVSADTGGFDPLRLCAQLRLLDRTRFLPILLVANGGDDTLLARALEIGVNDYALRPFDSQELVARLRTQVRRKRYNDHLRRSVTEAIELSVTDPLTGLHNRRYIDSHLQALLDQARQRGDAISVMMLDIDRFKSVNDGFGHDAGDAVLREFARRLRTTVRGIDLAGRFGGEEFVVVMPGTDGVTAGIIAERIRAGVEDVPFGTGEGKTPLSVTVSIGVASLTADDPDPARLMRRADEALYRAKRGGRNRVVAAAA